jgi:hypothetical protein
MARQKKKADGTVVVAEAIGRALGMVPGTAQALKVQHPHPIAEAMTAMAAGQERLAEATVAGGDPAGPIGIPVKRTAMKRRTTKSISRVRKGKARTQARVGR